MLIKLSGEKQLILKIIYYIVIMKKNILITGAGGSIGSELAKQLINLKPNKLVLLDHSETSLYLINRYFKDNNIFDNEIHILLGSINDETNIKRILKKFSIDIILHAAAYKHVSIVENNILEGFRNNVIGTYKLLSSAIETKVKSFILVSSDKAVRPSNIMGGTKRLAELIIKEKASLNKDINLSIVRFGNVLGSSGSVIPLFEKQIRNGGPITLTHPDITRYFMSISEASQLVLLAGSFGTRGEVFLLDMGQPIKIKEIAYNLVNLFGLKVKDEDNPNGDIKIEIIGKEPEEKLFEELLVTKESQKTRHPKIFKEVENIKKIKPFIPILRRKRFYGKRGHRNFKKLH